MLTSANGGDAETVRGGEAADGDADARQEVDE
jgi:hypothetical protein